MCLNLAGLILGLIGAIALTVSTLCLNPFQFRNGVPAGAEGLDSLYKRSVSFSTALIAVGFLLQIISAR